jgi:hypothetical protein
MGLLDDAIREHLELKRRRGADPSSVTRDEHDALGNAPGTASTLDETQTLNAEDELPDREADELDGSRTETPRDDSLEPLDPEPAAADHPEIHSIGQETVEIDMSSVLDEVDSQDPDWHEDARHMSHESSGSVAEAADVLEDTPDFLSQSPDEEQLWFEQRPPRDFDFDD